MHPPISREGSRADCRLLLFVTTNRKSQFIISYSILFLFSIDTPVPAQSLYHCSSPEVIKTIWRSRIIYIYILHAIGRQQVMEKIIAFHKSFLSVMLTLNRTYVPQTPRVYRCCTPMETPVSCFIFPATAAYFTSDIYTGAHLVVRMYNSSRHDYTASKHVLHMPAFRRLVVSCIGRTAQQ